MPYHGRSASKTGARHKRRTYKGVLAVGGVAFFILQCLLLTSSTKGKATVKIDKSRPGGRKGATSHRSDGHPGKDAADAADAADYEYDDTSATEWTTEAEVFSGADGAQEIANSTLFELADNSAYVTSLINSIPAAHLDETETLETWDAAPLINTLPAPTKKGRTSSPAKGHKVMPTHTHPGAAFKAVHRGPPLMNPKVITQAQVGHTTHAPDPFGGAVNRSGSSPTSAPPKALAANLANKQDQVVEAMIRVAATVQATESLTTRSTLLREQFGMAKKGGPKVADAAVTAEDLTRLFVARDNYLKPAIMGHKNNFTSVAHLLPKKQPDYKYGRCALVGNAGSLLSVSVGKAIDAHDAVLRINQAPTLGFAANVGSRTTFRLLNHKWSTWYATPEGVAEATQEVVNGTHTGRTVFVVSRSSASVFKQLHSALSVLGKRIEVQVLSPHVVSRAHNQLKMFRESVRSQLGVKYKGGDSPSSGVLALVMLLSMCNKVTVHGVGQLLAGNLATSMVKAWSAASGGDHHPEECGRAMGKDAAKQFAGKQPPYHYFMRRRSLADTALPWPDPSHSFTLEGDYLRALGSSRNSHLTFCIPPVLVISPTNPPSSHGGSKGKSSATKRNADGGGKGAGGGEAAGKSPESVDEAESVDEP